MRPVILAASWHQRYLADVPSVLEQAVQGTLEGHRPNPTSDKARLRTAVLNPLLKVKGLSVPQWAKLAGVNQAVAYDYLNGKSDPRPDNRKALAEALGLEAPDLPQ